MPLPLLHQSPYLSLNSSGQDLREMKEMLSSLTSEQR